MCLKVDVLYVMCNFAIKKSQMIYYHTKKQLDDDLKI